MSVCVLGPDGTGKSVLTLHLASRYAADADADTRIIYASTDLSLDMAQEIWARFCLSRPNRRSIPFEEGRPSDESRCEDTDTLVELSPCCLSESPQQPATGSPDDAHFLSVYLTSPPAATGRAAPAREVGQPGSAMAPGSAERSLRQVAFIDLAAETAGDDWGLLTRILGSLRTPGPDEPRHMLIIDAVEGMETLVGEEDSFGQKRSRRSRIAQIIRLAAGTCHVAFVVEEPRDNERLPEEFVTDLVIRLRAVADRDYNNRTIEIVKARGHAHIRGQHQITIRNGTGSKTGLEDVNPDDPEVGEVNSRQAYFQAFPSLHSLSREEMRQPPSADTLATATLKKTDNAGFGIQQLDEMLGSAGSRQADDSGLPRGHFTVLIGDDGTHKSRLGRAFLSACLRQDTNVPEVAVLLTTRLEDSNSLLAKLRRHTPVDDDAAKSARRRIVCRQLEVHSLSSAALMHIVQQAITKAKNLLNEALKQKNPGLTETAWKPGTIHPYAGHIRVVIDDLSTIRDTYPGVAEDPLFLPFLKQYLQRENVSTLVIDNQPGGPEHIIREEADRELRSLADHHIYTWHVPFFGDRRVAISALPPVFDGQPVLVRELRPAMQNEAERLEVDPHFELYMGLERGSPERVPLKVNLYAETEGFRRFIDRHADLMARLFRAPTGSPVLQGEAPRLYEQLREFRYLHGDMHLDHTLVYQVDEFWSTSSSRQPKASSPYVRLEETYLEEITVDNTGACNRFADPFRVYQASGRIAAAPAPPGTPAPPATPPTRARWEFFDLHGYAPPDRAEPSWVRAADRVPLMWDFGFLLIRRDAWEATFGVGEESGASEAFHQQTNIWNRLKGGEHVSWYEFFRACRTVARRWASPGGAEAYPFDLDMLGLETFSCLVLEVWASEVARAVPSESETDPEKIWPGRRCAQPSGWSLIDLVREFTPQLYRTWLLLGEVLRSSQFEVRDLSFETREAHPSAIAARHWFSTASDATAKYGQSGEFVPVALPGRFSVRGDWFLSAAEGSRSSRLAFQALDLLLSRRANADRLQLGVGLPVRQMAVSEAGCGATAGTNYLKFARTPLWDGQSISRRQRLTYGKLLELGAPNEDPAGQAHQAGDRFRWLWRSNIGDYDRHTGYWRKWLCRVLLSWSEFRALDLPDTSSPDDPGYDGFSIYKEEDARLCEMPSYKEFKALCEFLEQQLLSATLQLEDSFRGNYPVGTALPVPLQCYKFGNQ